MSLTRRLASLSAALLMLAVFPATAGAGRDAAGDAVDQVAATPGLWNRITDSGGTHDVPPADPFSPFGGPATVDLPVNIDRFGFAWIAPEALDGGTSGAFGNGGSFACGDHDGYVVRCGADDDGTGDEFADGFDMFVLGYDDPFPDEPNDMYDFEIFLGGNGDFVGSVEADLFNGLGDVLILRWQQGKWQDLDHWTINGFDGDPGGARVAHFPGATVFALTGMVDWDSVRGGIFKTMAANPSTPETVAAQTFPVVGQPQKSLETRPVLGAFIPVTTTTSTVAPTSTEATTTTSTTIATDSTNPDTSTSATTGAPAGGNTLQTTDDGGFPWLVLFLVLLGILLVGGGFYLISNLGGTAAGSGTFSDDQGNDWEYCEPSACFVEQNTVTDTDGRRVMVRAAPRGEDSCEDCSCVLFENPAGGGGPILLDEDGGWVRKKGGVEYSARCVKKV